MADGDLLDGYVASKELLEILFPKQSCRPSVRWLEMQRKARKVPFVKISRLVFFDPAKVRAALNNQHTAKFGGAN